MIEVLGILWKLFTNLPVLVSIIIELDREFKSYQSESDKAQKVKALKDAIAQAKATKDTTQLKALVNNILTGESTPNGS